MLKKHVIINLPCKLLAKTTKILLFIIDCDGIKIHYNSTATHCAGTSPKPNYSETTFQWRKSITVGGGIQKLKLLVKRNDQQQQHIKMNISYYDHHLCFDDELVTVFA